MCIRILLKFLHVHVYVRVHAKNVMNSCRQIWLQDFVITVKKCFTKAIANVQQTWIGSTPQVRLDLQSVASSVLSCFFDQWSSVLSQSTTSSGFDLLHVGVIFIIIDFLSLSAIVLKRAIVRSVVVFAQDWDYFQLEIRWSDILRGVFFTAIDSWFC